ncbi:hypothetical protein ACHAWO_009904 [Cyclotella atomus]|uniref:DOC domain-containing protein n=1 Tax=Cyclotella atomus TaxID=382360 RepID=A0ABD3P988_9STRA
MADAPEARADTPSPVPMSDDEEEAEEEFEDEEEDDESTHAEEPEPTSTRSSTRKPRDYRHLRIKSTPTLPLQSDPTISSSYRPIGHLAHWSLSSSKPGNSVDALRDNSFETYWQSDGLQPHYINIQFPRRQSVSAIALYMDFGLDESYTPRKMKIKVGNTFHNLQEVRHVEVKEPCGWCVIPLWRKWGEDVLDSILDPDGIDNSDDEELDDNDGMRRKKHHVPIWKRKPLRTHFVQIGVMSMHQNGRDTHIRQVKVFGPRDNDGNNGGIVGSSCRGLVVPRRGGNTTAGSLRVGANNSGGGAAEMMIGNGRLSMPSFQTVGMSQFSFIR